MAGLFDFFGGLDELAKRMAEMNLEPEHIQQAIGAQSPRIGDMMQPGGALELPSQAGRNRDLKAVDNATTGVMQQIGDFFNGTTPAAETPPTITPLVANPRAGEAGAAQATSNGPDERGSQRIQLSGLGGLIHPGDPMLGQDRPNIIPPNALPAATASGLPQAQMVRPEGPVGNNGAQMLAPPQPGPFPGRPGVVGANGQPMPIQPPPLGGPPGGIQGPQVRSTETTPVPVHPNSRAGELETRAIPGNIRAIVSRAAQKYGQDPNTMLRMAYIESKGDPNAKNKSGASGLFQFMPGTADDYGLSNPFDAEANADAAARLMRDNRQYLVNKLGREPTPGELYLAHQQGAGGAEKLLANPDASAAKLLGSKAVTQNGGTEDMTAAQFASMWTSKFDQLGDVPAGDAAAWSAPPGAAPVAADGSAPAQATAAPEKTFAQRLAEVGQAIKAPPPSDRGKPPTGVAPLPQPGQLTPNPQSMQLILSMLGGAGGQVPQVSPTLGQLLGGK